MEKRVFKFGQGSFAIVLPKKWIAKNGLAGSDSLILNENNKGELVLTARQSQKTQFIRDIDKNTPPEIMCRFVGSFYVRGITKLTIRSKDGLTPKQIDSIQDEIRQECPGFEIISQTRSEVQIEDLTNIKEIDIHRLLNRTKSLVSQEFTELIESNEEAVRRTEELVDRFYMLGTRYVNIIQPEDPTKYYRTILLLETIADELRDMIEDLRKMDKRILPSLKELFEKSWEGFHGNQDSIVEVNNTRRSIINSLQQTRLDKAGRRAVKDITTHSRQIAELGLLEQDPLIEKIIA